MAEGAARQAIRCLVSGRVQGVYYRAATVERAVELGVCGWVKNLPDGRVEVVACGPPDAIAALAGWLWQGPRAAHVGAVQLEPFLDAVPAGFVVAA